MEDVLAGPLTPERRKCNIHLPAIFCAPDPIIEVGPDKKDPANTDPEIDLADVIQFHLHQGKGKAMAEKRTNF